MEIGYHLLDYMVFVARGNDDLCGGVEHVQVMLVHVGEKGTEGGERRGLGVESLVWHPLGHMEVFLSLSGKNTHVIETFEGADTGGADSDGFTWQ